MSQQTLKRQKLRPVVTAQSSGTGLYSVLFRDRQTYARLPEAGTVDADWNVTALNRTLDLPTSNTSTGAWVAYDPDYIVRRSGSTIFVAAKSARPHGSVGSAQDVEVLELPLLSHRFISHVSSDAFPSAAAIGGPSDERVHSSGSPFLSITVEPVESPLMAERGYESVLALYGVTASTQDLLPPSIGESVERLVWDALLSLNVPDKARLGSRLLEIHQDIAEEGDSHNSGISISSLMDFLTFLKSNEAFRLPAISVSPESNIYASWKNGRDNVFSIHFLGNNDVRFVIFYPNERHTGHLIRLSGAATADLVLEVASPHGVRSWMSR